MEQTALVPIYTPPLPSDERERVAALERYRILDTPPEEAFETIVDAAVTALGMPVGLITFLDERRQWFKSKRGITISESERSFAFCAQTILTPEGLVVPDTLEDPRFRYNPFVTGAPFIRFYAGVPLCSPDGYAVGSLGVASHMRHPDFDREKGLATLERLGDLVIDEVELRLTQSKLRVEKHKLEFALQTAKMSHWNWDLEHGECELPAAIDALITHQHAEPMLPQSASLGALFEAVHVHDRSQLEQAFDRLIDHHAPISAVFRVVGREMMFWIELDADYAPESDQLIIGTVRDVTAQEQWRNKAIRVDRLHALSSLGAGVAHEINNPLSVVTTNLYLLSTWLERNDEVVSAKDREYVGRLVNMARRGAARVEDIVSSMLELSRSDETGEERTDPSSVLESVLRLLKSDIPPNTTLETVLEATPSVRGRPSVLAQVFVNLLLNAIDAIERGSPAEEQRHIIVHCRQRNSDWIEILVHDNGPGMADEDRARIFNPFFTTKPPGKGTGLGLAIAHSIVESLGGDISVESVDGRGTTARVSLPVDQRPFAGPIDKDRPVVH